jgi:hypothetical protein
VTAQQVSPQKLNHPSQRHHEQIMNTAYPMALVSLIIAMLLVAGARILRRWCYQHV